MKTSEILALIGAGYTKAEIDAMEKGEDGKPSQETPKQETAKPETPPAEQPKEQPKEDPNAALLAAINNLTAIVQKSNVRNVSQPAEVGKPADISKEVDDVLISLYNN